MNFYSRIRKFSKALVVVFMLFANFNGTFGGVKVAALSVPGTVVLDKTETDIGGGLYEITLDLSGVPLVTASDIVLVIDISGSMSGDRITAAKTAAKNFIDGIIAKNQGHRIAIVSFATNPVVVQGFSTNAATLKTAITNLSSNGGTHLEGGIYLATNLLTSSGLAGNDKVIIVLGDGQPTYGYDFTPTYTGPLKYSTNFWGCKVEVTSLNQGINSNFTGRFDFNYSATVGSGSSINFDKNIIVSGTCPLPGGGTDDFDFDKAYTLKDSVYWQADRAKGLGYSIYSIGLEVDSSGEDILRHIQNSGYYNAASDDLTTIYNTIANQIVWAARSAVVLDKIGDHFDFVQVSTGYTALDASYNSTTRILTWNIGNVGATSTILKYTISIHNGLPTGIYPTNEYAVVNYTNIDNHSSQQTFPQPKVTITGPVNAAPVANNQNVTTPEDTGKDITLTGTDPDSDPLTFSIVAGPMHGTLTGTGANLNYMPNANYFGSDSFTFKVNDGTVDSNTATVSITIGSVNDKPIADNQTVSTPEDTGKNITLTGSDPENDALTYVLVLGPTHGVLTGTGANRHYGPNANFSGSDSFTFKTNDGALDSEIATVTINVVSVNDKPVADNQTVSTPEDTGKNIILTGSDPENDALTYVLVLGPTHGVLTGTGANRHYEPNANFNGIDSFTFKTNDGALDSEVATVTINVGPANDAPVADDQNVTTPEDTAKDIILTGSDVDLDALNFLIVSGPSHGTLVFSVDHWIYTPVANYFGLDAFTFKVNDGIDDSNIATVSINVTSVNDAPAAVDQNITTPEDTGKDITLTGTDPDSDPLTFSIVVGPMHGTLTGTGANLNYMPNANYFGADSFTYKVNDGTVDSNVATISIDVTSVNDKPVADNDAFAIVSGTLYYGALTANDLDLTDSLMFMLVNAPLYGTVVINADGTYKYKHNGANVLPDSFTFKVNDGTADSNVATVSITVTSLPAGNRAPGTLPEAITVVEGGTIDDAVAGFDPDGDPIVFILVTDVANGSLQFFADGSYTYTHNGTETTADSFSFRSFDGKAYSAIRTAVITITPVNDAPVAVNGEDSTDFNTILTGNVHDLVSDVDGTTWSLSLVGTVAHGTIVLNADGSFTYTPTTGFHGTDSFTFKANDGSLNSNIATFTITVGEEVIIVTPDTPLSPLSFWWAYLLGLLLLLLFFLRPNLKYALVDKEGNEKVIRRHIFSNGKDDLFVDLNDKNVQGLVAVDLVVYKQLVKREQGRKITFNLFNKPVKTIAVPEDMKEKIEDQIKL